MHALAGLLLIVAGALVGGLLGLVMAGVGAYEIATCGPRG